MNEDVDLNVNEIDETRHSKVKSLLLNDTTYETLRQAIELGFPLLGTLYASLAVAWGWSNTPEVMGTIGALTLFCTGILKVARRIYNNSDEKYTGEIVLDVTGPERDQMIIAPKVDPSELPKDALFKVKHIG